MPGVVLQLQVHVRLDQFVVLFRVIRNILDKLISVDTGGLDSIPHMRIVILVPWHLLAVPHQPHYLVEILPTLAHFGGAHGSSGENLDMRLLIEGQDFPIGAVRRRLLYYGIWIGVHHLHAVEGC